MEQILDKYENKILSIRKVSMKHELCFMQKSVADFLKLSISLLFRKLNGTDCYNSIQILLVLCSLYKQMFCFLFSSSVTKASDQAVMVLRLSFFCFVGDHCQSVWACHRNLFEIVGPRKFGQRKVSQRIRQIRKLLETPVEYYKQMKCIWLSILSLT